MGGIAYDIEQQDNYYFGSCQINGDWISSGVVTSPAKAEMDIRKVISQKTKQ